MLAIKPLASALAAGLGILLGMTTIAQILPQPPEVQQGDYTLHEWGTFTSVSGSDGTLLPGLEREEEALPPFVHHHEGMLIVPDPTYPRKNPGRPMLNVTIKMETPIIYFYSDHALSARVNVDFFGGTISQWFPQRSGGEELQALEYDQQGNVVAGTLDLSQRYQGGITWDIDVQPPGEQSASRAFYGEETLTWEYPRQTDSNLLLTPDGSYEKYLFYRGLGNFELPVKFSMPDDATLRIESQRVRLQGRNYDADEPFMLVFQNSLGDHGRRPSIAGDRQDEYFGRPLGAVRYKVLRGPGAGELVDLDLQDLQTAPSGELWKDAVFDELRSALIAEGLFPAEADAMIKTWWKSYFLTSGLRVFWIVPRRFTDGVLPLHVEPFPSSTVRVLVGRSEVLSPGFEAQLLQDFAQNDLGPKNPWTRDRFGLAYQERVEALREATR